MKPRILLQLQARTRPIYRCQSSKLPSIFPSASSFGRRRHLATTTSEPTRSSSTSPSSSANATQTFNALGQLGASMIPTFPPSSGGSTSSSPNALDPELQRAYEAPYAPPEHHLHVYAHKHNTHLTLSDPSRRNLICLSCGNIGFRKAARGTYDAAYQLGAYLMNRMRHEGLLQQIQALELLMRGFGPGREAVLKILLGIEGQQLRSKVVRVVDKTRLKFGGPRSKKPRRLG